MIHNLRFAGHTASDTPAPRPELERQASTVYRTHGGNHMTSHRPVPALITIRPFHKETY